MRRIFIYTIGTLLSFGILNSCDLDTVNIPCPEIDLISKTSGSEGDIITVTGGNFQFPNASFYDLRIGGKPATIQSVDQANNRLMFRVDQNIDTGVVTLSYHGGFVSKCDSNQFKFAYAPVPAGALSLLAGSPGNKNCLDGVGNNARFNTPTGIAFDNAGNLYVADLINQVIRKITSTGVVTVLAGACGIRGSTNAVGTTARFNDPSDVVYHEAGNALYVCDRGNCAIRKIDLSTTLVTTYAGLPGTCTGATGGDNVLGVNARFIKPQRIALAFGQTDLMIGDPSDRRIRMINFTSGMVKTLAGGQVPPPNGCFTPGLPAALCSPEGVIAARGPGSKVCYAIDRGGEALISIEPSGMVKKLDFSTAGPLPGQIGNSRDLDMDQYGNLYWLNTTAKTIFRYSLVDHRFETFFNLTTLNSPEGLAIDPSNRKMYIVDANGSAIYMLPYK